MTWTSGNSLNVNATVSNNTKWTITIENSETTIANVATTSRIIRFNSDRFACYTTSTGTLVNLYKKVDTPTSPLASISVDASGTTTTFNQGAAFSHDGVEVTATYEDASTKDVTSSATFSTPDMTTAGTKTVTVSYTEGEVTKTATYDITVKEYEQPTQFSINLNNTLFGTKFNGTASGITDNEPVSGTSDNVTVTYAGAGDHYINNSQIRFYPNNKLTVEAPSGYKISKIVFTADGTWTATISADTDNGTYTANTKTWTGDSASVVFTGSGSGQCRMSSMDITLVRRKAPSSLKRTGNITLSAANLSTTATATGFFTTSSTGDITYKIADVNVATVDANGVVTPVAAGETTLTVSQAADDDYLAGSIDIVVTVQAAQMANASFNIGNQELAYGATLTLTKSTESNSANIVTDGEATLTSSNTQVASVDGLTITANAVGTATITAATTSSPNYNAGSHTFTVTVTAPAAQTTVKPATSALIFGESFGNNSGSAREWNDSYSVKSGRAAVYSGIEEYTVSNVKQGKNTTGSNGSGLNQSSQGTDASIIIGPLNVADYTNLELTYQWNAGSIKDTYTTKAFYATSAEGEYTEVSGTGVGATSFVERSYDLPAAAQVSTLYLKIVWNTSNTQAIIDELQLKGVGSAGTESVKLNGSGYATFCSEYPLDFSKAEDNGYSAWAITGVNIESGKITFEQVTGTVKGGTGLLLKGEASATVELMSAVSTTEPTNLLEGTLAPKYVAANEYYGLSGTSFVKINAGTVPAHKAILPVSALGSNGRNVKAFTFVFGDTTTGIVDVNSNVNLNDKRAIFSLSGQRLSKPQKGINIINGKKVLVK